MEALLFKDGHTINDLGLKVVFVLSNMEIIKPNISLKSKTNHRSKYKKLLYQCTAFPPEMNQLWGHLSEL